MKKKLTVHNVTSQLMLFYGEGLKYLETELKPYLNEAINDDSTYNEIKNNILPYIYFCIDYHISIIYEKSRFKTRLRDDLSKKITEVFPNREIHSYIMKHSEVITTFMNRAKHSFPDHYLQFFSHQVATEYFVKHEKIAFLLSCTYQDFEKSIRPIFENYKLK